jgi:hypothetical protein
MHDYGNDDVNRAVADWDLYNSTPYAPYRSVADYIGMSQAEWDTFLKTGFVPSDWEWD